MATPRTESADLFGRQPPRVLVALPWRPPLWLRAFLVLLLVAALVGVGYAADRYYPKTAPLRGTDAERQLAAVTSLPKGESDGIVTGDLLVERFYAVDAETGERYTADLVKGRVDGLQEATTSVGATSYILLLGLKDLQRNRDLLAAYVSKVAAPDERLGGYYLGLRAPMGSSDAFQVNYDGTLPQKRGDFHGPGGEDVFAYLVEHRFADVTNAPRLINVEGRNYLLSNTEQFPYFRAAFGVNKAIFISELILVDLTGRQQAATYYRLFGQFSRPTRQPEGANR